MHLVIFQQEYTDQQCLVNNGNATNATSFMKCCTQHFRGTHGERETVPFSLKPFLSFRLKKQGPTSGQSQRAVPNDIHNTEWKQEKLILKRLAFKGRKKKRGGGEKGAIFQYSFHSCDSTLAGKRSRSFGQKWSGGLQPNTHAPYIICGFKWNYKLVHGGVHRMCTKKAAVSCGTSHVTTKQHCKHITSVDTQNPAE